MHGACVQGPYPVLLGGLERLCEAVSTWLGESTQPAAPLHHLATISTHATCYLTPGHNACYVPFHPIPLGKRVKLTFEEEADGGAAGAGAAGAASNPMAGHGGGAGGGDGGGGGSMPPPSERRFRGQRTDTPSHPGGSPVPTHMPSLYRCLHLCPPHHGLSNNRCLTGGCCLLTPSP